MNSLLNGLKETNNLGYTENGARTYKSTMSGLCDLFAFGAAYRSRSTEDCILLFKKAYEEDPTYALKCLFYLRDVRGGQGERRFFRDVMRWLGRRDEDAVKRNLQYFPEYGRYDDWFIFFDTDLENDVLKMIKHQLALDMESYRLSPKQGISLLAKWLPSENASSTVTRDRAVKIRKYLNMTARQYRKTLSALRERINVLERLMSANKWDEIEFDKIPSKAGFKYRNAFARHDIERAKSEKNVQTYKDFVKDETKTVNTDALYPYEVVGKASDLMGCPNCWCSKSNISMDDTERLAINKYWESMKDYFKDKTFNGLCVCDTSGSMYGTPLDVAISLSMYCADRAKGPFAGHYISFSRNAKLIEIEGVDFCDKVERIYSKNLCENTNIESVFDLLLTIAMRNNCKQEDLPQSIIIVSDMEFDQARGAYWGSDSKATLMERIRNNWEMYGYEMPNLVFWNVNARHNNIPMKMEHGITFVSGMSPVIFEQVLTGKTGLDLALDKLDSERYAVIK